VGVFYAQCSVNCKPPSQCLDAQAFLYVKLLVVMPA